MWSKDIVAKMLPIMKAWQQGKTIQAASIGCSSWFDVNDKEPCFENSTLQWRVKPESVLRPWTFDEVPLGILVTQKPDESVRMTNEIRQVLGKTRQGELTTIHLIDQNVGIVCLLNNYHVCTQIGDYVGPCGVPQ